MIPLIPDTTYMIKSYEKNYMGPALLLKIKGLFKKTYIFRITDNRILELNKQELANADITQIGGYYKLQLKKTRKNSLKKSRKNSLKKTKKVKKN